MSKIRLDPTTEEWVIIARERAKRPHDFVRQQVKPELLAFSPSCPFCPGNYAIDTVPVGDENKNYYLWHLRIIPQLTEVAGFEIGSSININTALPEETAKFIRELKVE